MNDLSLSRSESVELLSVVLLEDLDLPLERLSLRIGERDLLLERLGGGVGVLVRLLDLRPPPLASTSMTLPALSPLLSSPLLPSAFCNLLFHD